MKPVIVTIRQSFSSYHQFKISNFIIDYYSAGYVLCKTMLAFLCLQIFWFNKHVHIYLEVLHSFLLKTINAKVITECHNLTNVWQIKSLFENKILFIRRVRNWSKLLLVILVDGNLRKTFSWVRILGCNSYQWINLIIQNNIANIKTYNFIRNLISTLWLKSTLVHLIYVCSVSTIYIHWRIQG